MYVNEIDDELIDFLKNSDKFCPHFHLSLQSMCDKTLKNMNRFYTVEQELEVINKIQNNFTLPYIGCDIIVGFPYEDDNDFKITYDNLEKSKLSFIHCFPYSVRKNTKASSMPQIQDSIKTDRAKQIAILSKKLHAEFLDLNRNTTAEILIHKKSHKTNLYSALTKNYIRVYFESKNEKLKGTLTKVNLSEYKLF